MTPEKAQELNKRQISEYNAIAHMPRDFDFGRSLPSARLPQSFIDFYVGLNMNFFEDERDSFLANFGDGPQIYLFGTFFVPEQITMQNGIISESIYAPKGSVILPPMHYAIADAFGQVEMRILINLDEASEDYGKLYLWHLAHDPLGAVGNDRGLAYLADDLPSFYAMLAREEEL